MSKKPCVHFFTLILAAWVLTFTVVSAGFYDGETASENSSVITKFHSSHAAHLASEPCEEKEARDFVSGFQVVFASIFLYATSGIVDSMLCPYSRLHSVSSFGNTTNLPLYLAKKSFLI